MKTCTKCHTEKLEAEYLKAKTCKDGLRPECRECSYAANEVRRKNKSPEEREADRIRRNARSKEIYNIKRSGQLTSKVVPTTALCYKCGRDLLLNCFYKRKDGSIRKECRDCVSVMNREGGKRRYTENKERVANRNKASRDRRKQQDPEGYFIKRRNTLLKHKYGITLEQYEQMLQAQGSACRICKLPEPLDCKRKGGFFVVDHDHKTGRLRGILCFKCNMGLGGFQDNKAALLAAASYLDNAAPV